MRTDALFRRYYFDRPSFVGGTQIFHAMCQAHLGRGKQILEIGAGPANPTSQFLGRMGVTTALDVSEEVRGNPDVARADLYDGVTMPYPDGTFDMCVSNYVLEHVADPRRHFAEACRVTSGGGHYAFRTPNLWHYVALGSRILPHSTHVRIANRMRGLGKDAHDPWPTLYRANTRRRLRDLAATTGWIVQELRFIEAEPCYGAAHAALFYPMMGYERLVNSAEFLAFLRVNILGVFRKPDAALPCASRPL